ncbi:hypothetical protein FACS189472_12750 [Alphaproteobacteria bacterium]|nr:hypothetical protein FACS189472_12750 [Alphaproteobacteria bacterium]
MGHPELTTRKLLKPVLAKACHHPWILFSATSETIVVIPRE